VPGRVSFVGVGRAEQSGGPPGVFIVTQLDAAQLFLRSSDGGHTWKRLNDTQQQFGQIRGITGDPKRFGRFYLATGGRGVLYADTQTAHDQPTSLPG
jgi:hypothetical protein